MAIIILSLIYSATFIAAYYILTYESFSSPRTAMIVAATTVLLVASFFNFTVLY